MTSSSAASTLSAISNRYVTVDIILEKLSTTSANEIMFRVSNRFIYYLTVPSSSVRTSTKTATITLSFKKGLEIGGSIEAVNYYVKGKFPIIPSVTPKKTIQI